MLYGSVKIFSYETGGVSGIFGSSMLELAVKRREKQVSLRQQHSGHFHAFGFTVCFAA